MPNRLALLSHRVFTKICRRRKHYKAIRCPRLSGLAPGRVEDDLACASSRRLADLDVDVQVRPVKWRSLLLHLHRVA
jgi:hypothetical protein